MQILYMIKYLTRQRTTWLLHDFQPKPIQDADTNIKKHACSNNKEMIYKMTKTEKANKLCLNSKTTNENILPTEYVQRCFTKRVVVFSGKI